MFLVSARAAASKKRRNETKNPSNEKTPCWPCAHPVMRVVSALRQQWYRNMAVSIARRPAANAAFLLITFLTVLINQQSVADVPEDASTPEEPPHRRFEYKYSFKGPHLSQSDGSVPFWIHTGSKFVPSCEHHQPVPKHWFTATFQRGQLNLERDFLQLRLFPFLLHRHGSACFAHSPIFHRLMTHPGVLWKLIFSAFLQTKWLNCSKREGKRSVELSSFKTGLWNLTSHTGLPSGWDEGSIGTSRDYSRHESISDGFGINASCKLQKSFFISSVFVVQMSCLQLHTTAIEYMQKQ